MPNKANARKALKQAKKRTLLNQARKEAFKTPIKNALKTKNLDEAKKFLVQAQKALDKAAKHGTIKKNTAARKLSRLMKKINGIAKK